MDALTLIASHILAHVTHLSPLFVALQGPQGSGKSFVTSLLRDHLSSQPHSLRVAVLSIDDLYLPHEGLRALASAHPANPLWRGRGQPGTHDVPLGVNVLHSLKEGNREVEIPRFEKSLFDGEGDRLPLDGTGIIVKPPVDVVIMEGWCMGFYPLSDAELTTRWEGSWMEEKRKLGLDGEGTGRKIDIVDVNEKLKEYVELWNYFDLFVQIHPAPSSIAASPYSIVYKWRLEQEHNMKARNGGKGMSDEAVKSFIDRYIPGYVFFGDGATSPSSAYQSPKWIGKGLVLSINEARVVVDVTTF